MPHLSTMNLGNYEQPQVVACGECCETFCLTCMITELGALANQRCKQCDSLRCPNCVVILGAEGLDDGLCTDCFNAAQGYVRPGSAASQLGARLDELEAEHHASTVPEINLSV
jgi:hypothetical protein